MPTNCKGFTVQCEDYYTIYLNARHCADQNRESLQHELEHIKNKDFDSLWGDVNKIEFRRRHI